MIRNFWCLLLVASIFSILPRNGNGEDVSSKINANFYIDEVCSNARRKIANSGLDPLKLPDQVAAFSKYLWFTTFYGEAKLQEGYLRGMSTLRRIGDAKLSKVNGDTVIIESQLAIDNIGVGYVGSAKFLRIGPSISAQASSTHAHINLRVSKNKVDEFKITSIGVVNAHIDGLGPLGWSVSSIASVVVNFVKDAIVHEIQGPIRNVVAQELINVRIPDK